MKAAIVIPAHNEAATIGGVVEAVSAFGTAIVVDDGSGDGTGDIARAAGAEVVRHEQNRGYDGALQSGFECADALGADVVVTFDADGQHDAAVLGRVLAPFARDEVMMVLGTRPRPARISERLFGLYGRLRYGVPDMLCGLKAYRRVLFLRHGRIDASRSIGTDLALAGLRGGVAFVTVPVPVQARLDAPRFGSTLTANWRILRALGLALRSELSARLAPAQVRREPAK